MFYSFKNNRFMVYDILLTNFEDGNIMKIIDSAVGSLDLGEI